MSEIGQKYRSSMESIPQNLCDIKKVQKCFIQARSVWNMEHHGSVFSQSLSFKLRLTVFSEQFFLRTFWPKLDARSKFLEFSVLDLILLRSSKFLWSLQFKGFHHSLTNNFLTVLRYLIPCIIKELGIIVLEYCRSSTHLLD